MCLSCFNCVQRFYDEHIFFAFGTEVFSTECAAWLARGAPRLCAPGARAPWPPRAGGEPSDGDAPPCLDRSICLFVHLLEGDFAVYRPPCFLFLLRYVFFVFLYFMSFCFPEILMSGPLWDPPSTTPSGQPLIHLSIYCIYLSTDYRTSSSSPN